MSSSGRCARAYDNGFKDGKREGVAIWKKKITDWYKRRILVGSTLVDNEVIPTYVTLNDEYHNNDTPLSFEDDWYLYTTDITKAIDIDKLEDEALNYLLSLDNLTILTTEKSKCRDRNQ